MRTTPRWPSWLYAILYTTLSMATEVVLIVVFRLKIPQHNAIIAPIILTLPPVLSAWVAGYRTRKELILLAGLTAVLTVIITLAVTRFTGVSTGLREPLFCRTMAGMLAALIANTLIRKATAGPQEPG